MLTWGAGSGRGGAWGGRAMRREGRRGAAAARGGRAAQCRGGPSWGGSSPSGPRGGSWPSARPPARRSPWHGPAPRAAGAPSGSAGRGGVTARGPSPGVPSRLGDPPNSRYQRGKTPLPCCSRGPPGRARGATLQVSRRVHTFLVSGFSTPHCRFRSHSFPAGTRGGGFGGRQSAHRDPHGSTHTPRVRTQGRTPLTAAPQGPHPPMDRIPRRTTAPPAPHSGVRHCEQTPPPPELCHWEHSPPLGTEGHGYLPHYPPQSNIRPPPRLQHCWTHASASCGPWGAACRPPAPSPPL